MMIKSTPTTGTCLDTAITLSLIPNQSYEMKPLCYQCQKKNSQWFSSQYYLSFCDHCVRKLPNLHYLLEFQSMTNYLDDGEMNKKLLIGGNKRFQQFLKCLSLLKGYHFETPLEIYTSPSVLYYRDVLQDEYNNSPPRPYDEEYYEQLSRKYIKSPLYSSSFQQILPSWVPDHSTNECMLCNVPFTLLNRRHHCRTCGLCLCDDCAPSLQQKCFFSWKYKSMRQCKLCSKKKKQLLIAEPHPSGIAM